MIPKPVWDEQSAFNELLRDPPQSEAEITEFLKDMKLCLDSECEEMLRTTTWKPHRRVMGHRPNRDHRLEEVTDIFKLWLTVAQGLGFSDDELTQAFWRKSMVCRQRHSEEWAHTLNRPAAVVDIDGVICDYTLGFCTWMLQRVPEVASYTQEILAGRQFFSRASQFGLTEDRWQELKHEFRSSGQKRFLPVVPGARAFLDECRASGLFIILLTSRPIDRYPNIYADTEWWLQTNHLPHDWLWWATDKSERLIETKALKWVQFVVEDDPKHVVQFLRVGLKVYWLQSVDHRTSISTVPGQDDVHVVRTLGEVTIPRLQGV